jgi:aconitate hydratase
MAPEYGATCGFFPIDDETLRYLRQTGRDEGRVALVEAYAKQNGFWRGADYAPVYTSTLALDLGEVVPAISGPKRPQDHVALDRAAQVFGDYIDVYDLTQAVEDGATVKVYYEPRLARVEPW